MSFQEEEEPPATPPAYSKKKKKRAAAKWSNLWLKTTKPLMHVVLAMQLQNPVATSTPSPSPRPKFNSPTAKFRKDPNFTRKCTKLEETHVPNFPDFLGVDRTLLLDDEVLLGILSKLPVRQRNVNCLVCKRWLNLQGRLVRSVRVLDWGFVESGRLVFRFPNLTRVDLVGGCLVRDRDSGVWLSNGVVSMGFDSKVGGFSPAWRVCEERLLPVEVVDGGLRALASGCPNLRRLAVMGASELGLLNVAEECSTLQELELHRCSDNVLRGIAACGNLQILRIVANLEGFYGSLVTDIGLTILAQGCKRLVKLELGGCEGSFDGIKAIGQCCQMLEELTICDHRMEDGWLAGISFCENLKSLMLLSCKKLDSSPGWDEYLGSCSFDGIKAIGQCCQMLEELTICDHRMEDGWLAGISFCENLKSLMLLSCKKLDSSPGWDEYLGSCAALERLHLHKCQLRDKNSLKALFKVCEAVKEIVLQDCWGFDNQMLSLASACRRIESLSLEGCSLITTEGLETLLLSWNELQRLQVESCKNIKNSEVSPALSALFSDLKELKWRPDSKSLLVSGLSGTGMGKKGSKFFRKSLRLNPADMYLSNLQF